MLSTPVIYQTSHTIKFSDLDPYSHMRTAQYAAYFVDHRMESLRRYLGWDVKALELLPFMIWVKRLEIDFIRPALADQEVTITSSVREFQGSDAYIECTMADQAGKSISRCLMVVAYVDKGTSRAAAWPQQTAALFFEK